MQNIFSLFDLLILIGMAQGIITSVLLFVSKRNQPSNKILTLAIIAFCLLSSKILLNTLGLTQLQYFRYFPLGIEYALAPLLYIYVVSLISPKFKFHKKHLWHFLPFLIFQSYAFFVYFNVVGVVGIAEQNQIANSFYYHPIKETEEYLVIFSVGGYLLAGYFKLKEYRLQLNNTISDNTFPTFDWLLKILILSSILGLIILINEFLDFFFHFKSTHYIHWQIFYLYNAFLIYYLGFVGYQQPDFYIVGIEQTQAKTKTMSLENKKLIHIKQKLIKALEQDKVFLDPTLSAKQLAKKLSISQANLSYVVNNSMNKNFRDLINHYRLEAFKNKVAHSNHSHLSILGLALDCGFNSEASFYRIFKKQTGCSPKEYIQNL